MIVFVAIAAASLLAGKLVAAALALILCHCFSSQTQYWIMKYVARD
ncbi:hypothetical protein H9643_21080 [Ochrobactrum sp. Sa2BUA5]|nr:hypothetical protein [Ochrobactrum gallinarum]